MVLMYHFKRMRFVASFMWCERFDSYQLHVDIITVRSTIGIIEVTIDKDIWFPCIRQIGLETLIKNRYWIHQQRDQTIGDNVLTKWVGIQVQNYNLLVFTSYFPQAARCFQKHELAIDQNGNNTKSTNGRYTLTISLHQSSLPCHRKPTSRYEPSQIHEVNIQVIARRALLT